jgi:class 3 adenylate cyclase/tetratricopeptide (TPR) repeat protein
MTEREQLEQAIAHMEAQRATLGDAVVDAALEPMRKQLAELEQAQRASAPALRGERKLVTVMFADISGFTALSERMDPEAVRDLMNACFDRLVPVVTRYEGTVDKFIGDEIMALFGAPMAHENDAERALRAALEMQSQLSTFNLQHATSLGIHFGINTGLVIAGGIGSEGRQEYSVMGDVVNLAARLEEVSERGEILVGPDTYRLTAPLFTFETLEPVRVKGKTEPVAVYRLVGLKPKPGRVRGLETQGISSPLVGRDAEFAALCACVERLANGQGGIVSIIGEAGVGKSRLMAEIRGDTRRGEATPPLQWLEGRTLSFGQTISYWPFQEILWRYAGITEDDSEAEVWRKLEGRVSALFGKETPEILPYLATLLTLEVRDEYAERVKYLDGEAMGHQVFLASRRFFERLAQRQPLVLVFEDLHWADESSALLLEHLLPLVERVGLLIIGVSRPYRQTPVARLREVAGRDLPDRYTEIHLTPLSQADSAQLVRNLLSIEDLPSRVREMIVRKAEGNPFYLEEIIRTLIDTGAVVHESATGRWRATAQIETITIPDTVQGVIMARVDRLEEDAKQVLRAASVIGRSFLYRVLCTIAEAERQLDERLTELQAIELIREKRRVPELEYIFKHALAQEATYESILLQRRQELHAQVGQAIEVLFTDRLDEFYGLLAYHYARAEVWEKAQAYLFRAGDQAGRVAADAEALAHYRQALAAYGRAFGDRWDPVQRAALERKMGEALFRQGERVQALDCFRQALIYLDKPLPASRWRMRLAILGEITRQIGHRLSPERFLKQMGRPVSPVVEEKIRLYVAASWIEAFMNPERFLLIALRLLNASERRGFPYGSVVGSMALGATNDIVSVFWLAGIYHRQAVALAEQIEHPGAVSYAYMGLAVHNNCLGEWDAAMRHSRRAARVFQETGDLHGWGYATYLLAVASAYLGDSTQALVHCRDLVRFGQEGADPQLRCWGLTVQGLVQRHFGQWDEAIATLQKASELAEMTREDRICIWVHGEVGRYHSRQGQLGQALTALEAGRQLYDERKSSHGGSMMWLPFWNSLAEACLLAAEQGDESDRAGWLEKAGRACQDGLRQGKAYRGVMPEAMRLRGTYEWLRGRPKAAQKWWRRGLALAEEMGQRHDLGLTHLEMGRRLGERTHLERAAAILDEIGLVV